MTEPEQATSGDYGYDLAHETGRREWPDRPDAERDAGPPVAAARPRSAAADEDFGYDEAHDF